MRVAYQSAHTFSALSRDPLQLLNSLMHQSNSSQSCPCAFSAASHFTNTLLRSQKIGLELRRQAFATMRKCSVPSILSVSLTRFSALITLWVPWKMSGLSLTMTCTLHAVKNSQGLESKTPTTQFFTKSLTCGLVISWPWSGGMTCGSTSLSQTWFPTCVAMRPKVLKIVRWLGLTSFSSSNGVSAPIN